ncbi:MAG: nucleotide pyrophosphohydrolase [Tissierellia bacterium]|nr:nucleotide pyrophosphohydrolase [Tissierellia bacterium]
MLSIVGLGPGGLDQLSLGAFKALQEADKIYLRTAWHPAAQELELPFQSFDWLYDEAEDFDSLYQEIARQIAKAAEIENVVYAVPGSPFVAEKTVEMLMALKPRVYPGASFLDVVCAALGIDFIRGLLIEDGLDDFKILPSVDLLLVQVYKKEVASQVKLRLMEVYDDEHPVTIIGHAGTPEEKVTSVKLFELDRFEGFDHLTTLYIPRNNKSPKGLGELYGLMEKLLAPGGCPWDRAQTHQSLKPYLLEESYEVMEAIDQGDFEALEDELGDLLFQVVFHTALAAEQGYFSLEDVIEGSYEKIFSRHTHVFSSDEASNPEEVLDIWEKNKSKEQGIEKRINSIPKNSALHYGQKLKKLLGMKKQSSKSDEQLLDLLETIIEIAVDRDLSLEMALMDRMSLVVKNRSYTRDSI